MSGPLGDLLRELRLDSHPAVNYDTHRHAGKVLHYSMVTVRGELVGTLELDTTYWSPEAIANLKRTLTFAGINMEKEMRS